jgi:SOS regulatory protein LexA
MIKDFGVSVLVATPSYALYLAESAERLGYDPRKDFKLRVGLFGGEGHSDRMRKEIENKLGILVTENYGLSEIIGPGVSGECYCQCGMHVNEDYFYPEIIDPDTGKSFGEADASEQVRDHMDRADVVDIPVIGRIAAGTPILAEQNIDETIPVPARFLPKGTSFMLTVKGESMVEAGIMDGDYILVHQQNTANNGEIVVAMVDGFESEATVKTFYKESGHIRLQPENQNMSPIIVSDVKILGLVKGVFRYL